MVRGAAATRRYILHRTLERRGSPRERPPLRRGLYRTRATSFRTKTVRGAGPARRPVVGASMDNRISCSRLLGRCADYARPVAIAVISRSTGAVPFDATESRSCRVIIGALAIMQAKALNAWSLPVFI